MKSTQKEQNFSLEINLLYSRFINNHSTLWTDSIHKVNEKLAQHRTKLFNIMVHNVLHVWVMKWLFIWLYWNHFSLFHHGLWNPMNFFAMSISTHKVSELFAANVASGRLLGKMLDFIVNNCVGLSVRFVSTFKADKHIVKFRNPHFGLWRKEKKEMNVNIWVQNVYGISHQLQ